MIATTVLMGFGVGIVLLVLFIAVGFFLKLATVAKQLDRPECNRVPPPVKLAHFITMSVSAYIVLKCVHLLFMAVQYFTAG